MNPAELPPSDLPMDRGALAATRRHLGLPASPSAEPSGESSEEARPVCTAPGAVLVVDADGALRACEFGSATLADGPSAGGRDLDWSAVWQGAPLRRLRVALTNGTLPGWHCGGCIRSCRAEGIHPQLPLLREYGAVAASTGKGGPHHLMVRVPSGPLAAGVDVLVASLLPRLQKLTLIADELVANGGLAELMARLRSLSPRPAVVLRIAAVGDADAAIDLLVGTGITEIEIELSSGAFAELETARVVAQSLGAALRARFVPTPAAWFELEDAALRCAVEPVVPLELRLEDGSGSVPLATVAVEDLAFVRACIATTWDRLGVEARPRSLGERAFSDLLARLRGLLQQQAAAALVEHAPAAMAAVALPPLHHSWCSSPARRDDWMRTVLGQGDHSVVRAWLQQQLASDDARARLVDTDWLRLLTQRVAAEVRMPQALEALRSLYADSKQRTALVAADAAFAERTPLAAFGGPWAVRLGLGRLKARKRPFAIPKANPAVAGSPDVTVLIPSYRHEDYVVDAIRSVLAQRGGGVQVLVVDDCSPDGTVQNARSVKDPRVTVSVNEENLGLGNSVLRALERVTTPFVAILNSDDVFHPDRIARCRAVLLANASVQLVTTGLALIDHDGTEITTANASLVLDGQQVYDWVHWYRGVTPPADLPPDQVFARLLESNFLATSSNLVVRTEWLRQQSESLRSLKYCLDWQLFLEAALEGALHHLPEPLAGYRLHATNTVWFREGRRWSYYLEVNRVASTALQRFAATGRADDEKGVMRVLDAIEAHLSRNRETDGYAMLLNSAVDSLRLDGLAAASAAVQQRIQNLNRAAEEVRVACDRARAEPAGGVDRHQALRILLGDLAAEQARSEHDLRQGLQGYCDALEGRLRECWDGRHQVENEKSMALGRVADLDRRTAELTQQVARIPELDRQSELLRMDSSALRTDNDALRTDNAAVRSDREAARVEVERGRQDLAIALSERHAILNQVEVVRRDLDAVQAERELVGRELAAATAERERFRRESEDARADGARLRDELGLARNVRDHYAHQLQVAAADLERELAKLRELDLALVRGEETRQRTQAELEAATADGRRLAVDLVAVRSELESAAAEVRELTEAKRELLRTGAALQSTITSLRDELSKLGTSREFRSGNFLWNKLPLGYMSRRGKKWYRRMLDAKNRGLMWLSRLFGRSKSTTGTAVVAACWQWPIYSHTFVYQEMLGLTHMGLDLKLFLWEQGDLGQLHKAFDYLKDHNVQLQPVWEIHLRDRDHFEKTKPGRLRAFLEKVAKATGRTVDDLEKEPIVLQGCTFARMAEMSGANYLHSYFFYDQSFMVMQAAFLLDIPRGVSCYADHMLDDYPWKLVPLQVELSSVVVATSARIKRELSAKSNGKYDDKIIVKPNGVDGARFPAVARTPRQQGEPFHVVSISRIEPKKGLTHLVEAVAELKKRGKIVVAHVIGSKDLHSKGSADYAEQFDRLIRDLGLGDQIVQHGMVKQEDMAPILKQCRAFVAPYVELGSGDKDGIPTAMLEGLASGLPVITTNSGSILEVVDDGVEGLVVPQRNSVAFAEALEKLIGDPLLEQRMSTAARARFDREFDIRVTEKRLHERVSRLLAQARKSKKR